MTSRLETFRALHAAGCFVMPSGFEASATFGEVDKLFS